MIDITLEEFFDSLIRLQAETNGLDKQEAKDKVEPFRSPLIGEFNIAHQTAVAVFCTQKGNESDVRVLRGYLNEAYSGNTLAVEFLEENKND